MLVTGLLSLVSIQVEGRKGFGWGNISRMKNSRESDAVEVIFINVSESVAKYMVPDSKWNVSGELAIENGKPVIYVDNMQLVNTKGAFYNKTMQLEQSGALSNGAYRNPSNGYNRTTPNTGATPGYGQAPTPTAPQVAPQGYQTPTPGYTPAPAHAPSPTPAPTPNYPNNPYPNNPQPTVQQPKPQGGTWVPTDLEDDKYNI